MRAGAFAVSQEKYCVRGSKCDVAGESAEASISSCESEQEEIRQKKKAGAENAVVAGKAGRKIKMRKNDKDRTTMSLSKSPNCQLRQ
jgi:hypothetical protein